jgi:hypothetical protein
MSSDEQPGTIICLWCNRVMTWGRTDILYDVCTRCVPTVLATIDQRLDEDRRKTRRRGRKQPAPMPTP